MRHMERSSALHKERCDPYLTERLSIKDRPSIVPENRVAERAVDELA